MKQKYFFTGFFFVLSLAIFFGSFIHLVQAQATNSPFLTISTTSVVEGGTYSLTADSNPSMQYGCWVEKTAESVASQTQQFGNAFYLGAITWNSILSGPAGVYRYDLVCQLNDYNWTFTFDTIRVTVTPVSSQTFGTINVSSNIAGGSYTLTGPATLSGGGTSTPFTDQPLGTYTITWNAVSGYITPASSSQTLTDGGTISFSGNYGAITPPTINVRF